LQVLEAVHAVDSRLPVVIVTGTGSEEVAVEAMKRGAADYIIKTPSHIQRLPYTIRSVLEMKRLEERRIRAEQERDRLFNYSLDLLCIAGSMAAIIQVNPAWEENPRWTCDDLAAKPWREFVHPDDIGRIVSRRRATAAGKSSWLSRALRLQRWNLQVDLWERVPAGERKLIFIVARDSPSANWPRRARATPGAVDPCAKDGIHWAAGRRRGARFQQYAGSHPSGTPSWRWKMWASPKRCTAACRNPQGRAAFRRSHAAIAGLCPQADLNPQCLNLNETVAGCSKCSSG
jgi:PAS domain S-box-containing protein